MELLAKRREDRLLLSLKTNAKIKRKMDAFWSGIEDPEADPVAAARDDSDLTLSANNIAQEFEKNVFHLFRNNLQNAQTLIGQFRATDYASFNAIFPKLMERFYGNAMLDVRSVFVGAKALMAKHQPNPRRPPPAAPVTPATPASLFTRNNMVSTPYTPYRPSRPSPSPIPPMPPFRPSPAPMPPMSQAGPSAISAPALHDEYMDCPIPGCNSTFKRSGLRRHNMSVKHQAAVRAQMRGKTPEKKDWKNSK